MNNVDETLLPKEEYFRAIKGDIRFVNLTDRLQEVIEALECRVEDPKWRPKKIRHKILYLDYNRLIEFHEFIYNMAFPEKEKHDWRPYDLVLKISLREKRRQLKRP